MGGISPKRAANCVSRAAPVGVHSSPAVNGNAAQQNGRRRGGNGKNAVGAADVAAADVHGRDDDLLRREPLKQQAHGCDVRKRVHRADLMKVDLVDRPAVGLALCCGQTAIDGEDIVPHTLRDRQGRNARADVRHAGVGMRVFMGMLMVMLVNMTASMCVRQRDVLTLLLRAVHGHGELRAADAALFGAHGRGDNAGDAQRIELLQKCLRLRQQLEQRRREHIARSAHAAVKIQCFHGLAPI